MKSPTAIISLNSMQRSSRNQQHQKQQKQQQTRLNRNNKPNGVLSNILNGGRLSLWVAGSALAILAAWLLFTSLDTQWQLGMLIAASWLATIFFNTYSIDYLIRKANPPKQKAKESSRGKAYMPRVLSSQNT